MLDSVVAGAVAGIAGIGLDLGVGGALVLGAAGFLLAVALFAAWARRMIEGDRGKLVVRFPTPPGGGHSES